MESTTKEKQFRVVWEIDEYCETPLEAIHKAIRSMPRKNKNTMATVFTVTEMNGTESKVPVQIDLLEVSNKVLIDRLEDGSKQFGLFTVEGNKRIHSDREFKTWSEAYRYAINCAYEVKDDIQ